MRGIEISLREDGLFEAKASVPGAEGVRITHDVRHPDAPWIALGVDETGVRWVQLGAFSSLDGALDFAARSVSGDLRQAYSVVLPDGTRFLRPGRKPAEEVMASAGWVFVTSLIGFFMVQTEPGTGVFDARRTASETIASADVMLGEVHFVEADDDGLHWCADVSLEYDGFLRIEEIETEARAAFAAAGADVLPYYDFRTRVPVAGRSATIIQFPGTNARKSAA